MKKLKPFRSVLLLLGTFLLNPAAGFDGTIDSASVVIDERVRFEAGVPGAGAAAEHQVFSLGAGGVYFTGSPVRGPGTNLPQLQITPLPASAIRKFDADGNLAWMRLRQIHMVRDENTGVESAFERHSPEEDYVQIPLDEAKADFVTHVLATDEGGVVVVADLYQQNYGTFEGPNGSQGRSEFPEQLNRTLYRKFDASGSLIWRQMTYTDTDLNYPTNTLRILRLPDGSLATLLRTVPYPSQNTVFNRQAVVRLLDGATGEILRQKIFGGEAPMDFRDSVAKTLELDAQGRLYVLAREQTAASNPDPALTRNIVRRMEPSTFAVTQVEAVDQSGATHDQWTLLAVDGEGAIHVGGITSVWSTDVETSTERAFVVKHDASLAYEWRSVAPLPPRVGVYMPFVEPTGLHVGSEGVTLLGNTHAVRNDGFYRVTRGETMRFSPAGALVWHCYLDAELGDDFYGKQFWLDLSRVDSDGNVYIAGSQTTGPGVQSNFIKYSSSGLLQFIRFLETNQRHSAFTLAANGNPTSLAKLTDTGGESVILEVQNPALNLTVPVTVTITKPVEGARLPHPVAVNLAATVTKSFAEVPLQEVAFFMDGERIVTRTSAPFDVTVDNPGLGAHTLVVKAYIRNMGEFASAPVSFVIGNGVPPPVTTDLTVSLAGPANAGSVTPGFEGVTTRIEGKSYQVTASAKPGFLFTHWSGGSTSTQRTLRFVMTPSLTLTAHFAVNPFLTTSGMYVGLGEMTGGGMGRALIRAKVGATGAISMRMTLGGVSIPLKGQFTIDGAFDGQFTINGKAVAVHLQLDVTNGTNRMTGTVTVDGAAYALEADREIFARTNPAPQAGLYTFILPNLAGPGVPAGSSAFTTRIKANGSMVILGSLADGTPIARGGKLGADGSFAIHASLYRHQGVLAGDLTFNAVPDPQVSDVIGLMLWAKPATAQTAAFSAEGAVLGSAYTVPAIGQTPFGAPGPVRVQFGTTPAIGDVVADLNATGKAASPVPSGFALQIQKATGAFLGRAPLPLRTARFSGVVLLKQGIAAGFVKGEAVGTVSIAAEP